MRLMKSVGHEVGGIQNLCKILGGGMHFMTKILGGGIQIFVGRKSKSPGPPLVVNTEPSLRYCVGCVTIVFLNQSNQNH